MSTSTVAHEAHQPHLQSGEHHLDQEHLYTRNINLQPMDSPVLDRLFKRLFTHRPCTACARSAVRPRTARLPAIQTRQIHRRVERSTNESSWQQRTDYIAEDKLDEYKRVPMVTSDQLRMRRERPRRVKMLMRDFIEGWTSGSRDTAQFLTGRQTVYTTRRMATSPSRPSSSLQGTLSTFAPSPTKLHFTKN